MKYAVQDRQVRSQALDALFIVLGLLAWPCGSSADTHYVSLTGGNVAPYTTAATAATSIQPAVDASEDGDIVRIAGGTYGAGISVNKRVIVEGVGVGRTLVDGNNAVQGFSLAANAVVAEMSIMRGRAYMGGGVAGGIVSNCVLAKNSVTICETGRFQCGGGAYGSVLYNCVLSENYVESTGDWWERQVGGGAYESTLYNCTLSGNGSASRGAAATCTLYNCVISGHNDEAYPYTFPCIFYNCIINNDDPWSSDFFVDCLMGVDPKLVGGGDYSLRPDSPCINAAGILTATTRDILGDLRGIPDIGAFEFVDPQSGILADYTFTNRMDIIVQSVMPRSHSNLIDIDYLYTNSLPRVAEIRGLVYFEDRRAGALTYASGFYPLHTLAEGTATNYGCGVMPAATSRRLTWDAGTDISHSIQNLKLLLFASEPDVFQISQHFVTIPASGTHGALTMSRYAGIKDEVALNRALVISLCRGWTRSSGTDLYAVGGAYEGQLIFVNSGTPTEQGKLWMCEKLGNGIRLATTAEIQRAQEATTPGTIAQRTSYYWPGMKVNAFGIETGAPNAWHFVKE